MPGHFTMNETLITLKAIFEKHKDERVCVIGTICVGKTTLFRELSEYHCEDLDDVLWPNIPKKEAACLNELNETPWTPEHGTEMRRLIAKYGVAKPGRPLFGSTILDCEAVVYLDISDALLARHCAQRGDSFEYAKKYKEAIEDDWNNHKTKSDKVFYCLTVME